MPPLSGELRFLLLLITKMGRIKPIWAVPCTEIWSDAYDSNDTCANCCLWSLCQLNSLLLSQVAQRYAVVLRPIGKVNGKDPNFNPL